MEAKLRAIAGKICAHFDLAPVGVSIAELEIELDGGLRGSYEGKRTYHRRGSSWGQTGGQ